MKRARSPSKDGVRLAVRLTPKADRDALVGVSRTAEGVVVSARVRAVPEDGKANAALTRLIAEELEVPASAVSVDRGGASRLKILRIQCDGARLSSFLERLSAET